VLLMCIVLVAMAILDILVNRTFGNRRPSHA
jgi:hypothetical protein